jgi:hypothetical protein
MCSDWDAVTALSAREHSQSCASSCGFNTHCSMAKVGLIGVLHKYSHKPTNLNSNNQIYPRDYTQITTIYLFAHYFSVVGLDLLVDGALRLGKAVLQQLHLGGLYEYLCMILWV